MADQKQSASTHHEAGVDVQPPPASAQTPGAQAEKQTSFVKAIIDHPWVVLYSIPVHVSSVLWGFDIGVGSITNALPGFKLDFGYEYHGQLLIGAVWNALWGAMTSLGLLVGGIACGYISDWRGRRFALAIGCCLSILGVGIMYAANSPAVLLVAKSINGFSLGFFLTIAPMYASEISPKPLRPVMTAAVNLFICAGQLTAIGIGNTRFAIMGPASYRVLFAAQWAFPVFVLACVPLMPESPWYLVRKQRHDDARKSLVRLHRNGVDVEELLSAVDLAVAAELNLAEGAKGVSYADCFRGTNARRTRIVCGMFVIQQFTGIGFYAQALYFLGITGLDIKLTFQLALAGFGAGLVGNVASWFIMDYVGRRRLLLAGIIINGLLLMAVGIAGSVPPTKGALYFIGFAMNFAQLFYAPTVGAVSWAVSAETSSTRMRAKTQGLATVTNALASWLMNFVTPYLINTDEANLGGKAGFFWLGLCVLGFGWVWLDVPELKGRDFVEIDYLFETKTPARQFRHAQVPTAGQIADKLDIKEDKE
ncbi:general substrate transporter [Plectosphaerella plurivora]|uniref:General substrate transporter n=1 Tax=Plectosphaerella plurivora TaxID=936078 RepID=A0A9P9AAW4_9PEZI|nr:general substrate transporter [Plectosphaerella plurivora]